MDKKEFAVLAATMRTIYHKEKILETKQAMEIWHSKLSDIPYTVASAALDKWASTQEWSPTIADLRRLSAQIVNGEKDDWSKAWANLLQAIRRYGYMREPQIRESVDDITRQILDVMGLQSICESGESDNAYRRREFRELYEGISRARQDTAQLPMGFDSRVEAIRAGADKKLLNGVDADGNAR